MRRQMRNRYPGQDQKTRIVSDKADVPPPCFRAPSYILVPAAQVAGGRTPRHTCDGSGLAFIASPDQILQVLAHGLFIGQVVIMLHETVEQWLVGGSPHLFELDGLDVTQRSGDGRRVYQYGSRRFASHQRIERD